MTRTGAAARPPLEDRTESFIEWLQLNWRQVAAGVIVVAAVAAGAALYQSSKSTRATKAESALADAHQAFFSNNAPLAKSDLGKIVTRYEGTTSAVQASLLLAQLLYSEGKHAEGIAQLRKIAPSASPALAASVHAMTAVGLEDQGKYDEAAAEYRIASEKAIFAADKQNYRADQARTLMRAGKNADALVIWKEIAADETSNNAGEARIRIGEIEAQAAGTAVPTAGK